MDKLFDAMYSLFVLYHGRDAKTDKEVVVWARREGLITPDEFGAFVMLKTIVGWEDDPIKP